MIPGVNPRTSTSGKWGTGERGMDMGRGVMGHRWVRMGKEGRGREGKGKEVEDRRKGPTGRSTLTPL